MIGRCLQALVGHAAVGELEVIVVCNGCTDRTAEVARGFGPPVRVIETEVGSKPHALNLGDAAAIGFPRFYIDADVVLPLAAVRIMAQRLEEGLLAIAPLPIFDASASSWAVQAYYDIHQRLPAFREGIGGSGVYGLSEVGRARFGAFPKITADDGFVRLQFRPDERATLIECRSIVYAPRTLRELVAIKTRSYAGTAELKRLFPQLWGNLGPENGNSLKRLALRPWLWPRLAAYTYVKVAARLRARRTLGRGGSAIWERDHTSRQVTPAVLNGVATADVHEVDRAKLAEGLGQRSGSEGKARRVLAVASGGGHWVQLLRVAPAFTDGELAFVTVNPAYRSQVASHRFYTINDATRWNKLGLISMALKLAWIIRKERPDVIISTGAAPGYFALRIGKLLGVKTVWIDSIANVEILSLSGQKVGRYADLWLTQWPHLASPEGPHFAGAVL